MLCVSVYVGTAAPTSISFIEIILNCNFVSQCLGVLNSNYSELVRNIMGSIQNKKGGIFLKISIDLLLKPS